MISKREINKLASVVIGHCILCTVDGRLFAYLHTPNRLTRLCPVPETARSGHRWQKVVRNFLLSDTTILFQLHSILMEA